MTPSSFLVQQLFEGLHRLNETAVQRTLKQGVDLTARNAQGEGVFHALFQRADLEALSMDPMTGYDTLNRLEEALFDAGAQVSLADTGIVLSLRLEHLFEAVREDIVSSDDAMERLEVWLHRPPFQGAGASWGDLCAQTWLADMGEAIEMEHEEAMAFGVPSFTALVREGMDDTLLALIPETFPNRQNYYPEILASVRQQKAQSQGTPTASRRRRPT